MNRLNQGGSCNNALTGSAGLHGTCDRGRACMSVVLCTGSASSILLNDQEMCEFSFKKLLLSKVLNNLLMEMAHCD